MKNEPRAPLTIRSGTRRIILLQELAQAPRRVKRVIKGLPPPALNYQPDANAWTPHMVLSHLANLEPLYEARIQLLLEENDPDLVSLGPEQATPHSEESVEALMKRFETERRSILKLLYGLSADEWHRQGRHEKWGRVDLRRVVVELIQHDHGHIGQLVDLRHAWERAHRAHEPEAAADRAPPSSLKEANDVE